MKKKIENNKNATKNSCIEKKVKKLKNAKMRVVEKKVEDRGKTVKNYKKKVEERKNACSDRKEKLKSMVKEIVKSVKSVVKEIVKSVKSVVKVRSIEKACSEKSVKKKVTLIYTFRYLVLYIIIVKYNKLIAFIN